MRFYFALSLILITTFSYAQQYKGFSLGLNFSPNYDNFSFVGKGKEYFTDIKNYKQSHWGYTYGLTFRHKSGKRTGFESGVLLTKKGCTLDRDGIAFSYMENYYSVEVPLKFSYKIVDAKVSCSINVGINPSVVYDFKGEIGEKPPFINAYLNKSKAIGFEGIRYVDLNSQQVIMTVLPHSEKNYRIFNLIPSTSLAFSYDLTPKISIGLEPTFRFSLFNQVLEKYEAITIYNNQIDRDVSRNTSQIFWNYGINTSIYYKL